MEDMIIDLDIEDDLIKKFLLHKLEEIKLSNSELEQQIQRRQELLNECVEKIASEVNQNILQITDTWQRNLNNKWIIGIEVKNTGSYRCIKDVSVLLNWDSPASLMYNVKTFCQYKHPEKEKSVLPQHLKKIARTFIKPDIKDLHPSNDEWIKNEEIKDNLSIIISFDVPNFVDKLEYNISGILRYTLKEKRCQLNIPIFKIQAQDIISNEFSIKHSDIINGTAEAYLSTLIANEETELIVRVPQNSHANLGEIFEIELMFKKANIVSRTKEFFYKDNIAGSSDSCLLMLGREDQNLYSLSVFTWDQTTLQRVLHLLYQHIADVVILPKKYKENLLAIDSPMTDVLTQQPTLNQNVALKSTLQEFGKCLKSQLNLVELFYANRLDNIPEETAEDKDEVNLNVNIQDYQNFRKQLTDLEFKSDLLYAKTEKFAPKLQSTSKVDME